MSDYEHIRGSLKPTNKTVDEYVGEVKLASYHSNKTDYFSDVFYRKAVEINGMVYEVDSQELDPNDDIYRASWKDDGSIEFELRYYNGGCSFSEAMETALENGSA